MKHRSRSLIHDILGGLAVACLISTDLGAGDWSMDEPTNGLSFTIGATIAGYGDAPSTSSGYLFRAIKRSSGSIVQSTSGTSENGVWDDELVPPENDWPVGESVLEIELRAGGSTHGTAIVSIDDLEI